MWVTPKGTQDNRAEGIGIEFSNQDAALDTTIESYLAGALTSDRVAHTLQFNGFTLIGEAFYG